MRAIVLASLLAAVTLASAARAGVPEPGFSDTAVATGLSQPAAVAFLPDGTMLVAEKTGNVVLVDGLTQTTLGTIAVCTSSEMGLLGIAVDPDFTNNGFIYLYRTNGLTCGSSAGRVGEVIRVTKVGNSLTGLTVLLTGARTDNGNHDGGVLRIGPDGKLYVGVGDTGLGDNQGGPGSATNPYAQDLNEINGKILRLNLDGTIPTDNPFFGQVGKRGEIFAYGFRNPFRMSFDPATGSLWVGDVGDLTVEEVDIVTSGGNYGWPACEGNLPAGACATPGFVAPIFTDNHGGGSLGGCLIGGTFGGSALGAFDGQYFFGDCNSSKVYRAVVNGTRDDLVGAPVTVVTNAGTPSDFVAGPDGAIYYTAVGGGDVRRIAAAPSGNDSLLGGKTISLKLNPQNTAKKTLSVTSKDPAITLGSGNGSSDDPVVNGGSLRVVGGTFDDEYPMPTSGWTYVGKPGDGKGYKYKDRLLVNGPVNSAMLRGGKLVKATGKGIAIGHMLATDPSPVSVVYRTGTKHYCMSFGGTTTFRADRSFTAKNAAAPGACPP